MPAAARASGAFGTFWSTDLRLNNPTSSSLTATIYYLPDAAYAADATSGTVILGAGETVLLENVLETKLGIATNTAGALHITAPADIYAESRTFTPGATGTYGQRIPGIPASQAVAAGESVDLLYIDNSTDFRTNFGIVDAGGAGVAYTLTAYNSIGGVIGTPFNGTVGVNQWDQFNPLDQVGAGAQTNARVKFAVTSGKAIPYASQVDNASGDPIFIDGTKIKGGGGSCGTGSFYGTATQYVPGDATWGWNGYINFPMLFIFENNQLLSIQDPTPDLIDSGDEYNAVYMTPSINMMLLAMDKVFDSPLPVGDGGTVDVSYSISYGVGSTVLLTGLWRLQASFACPNYLTGSIDVVAVALDPDYSFASGHYYWNIKAGVQ